jgi:hypothetical protein
MPTRMSDFSVFLTLCGVIAFVVAMLALGMVHSVQAALGFAVIGYAILYLGSGLIGLARDLARARR